MPDDAAPTGQDPGEQETPAVAKPPTAKGPRRRRKQRWPLILNISAVAGVVAGIVFGAAELISNAGDNNSDSVPADERLELVDFEFSTRPARVTVLEYLEPGDTAKKSPYPERSATPGEESELHYPLVVTLRNPSDDPAVLTGVKLVVHEVITAVSCGTGPGGGVAASLNFSCRFPTTLSAPWEQVNPQNFAVEAHSVDALSITAGPEATAGNILLWRFSVFGVSKGGREAHWGDGVGVTFEESLRAELETTGDISKLSYEAYVVGDSDLVSRETIRACAARTAKTVEQLTAGATAHPGIPPLVAAYRKIEADYGRS